MTQPDVADRPAEPGEKCTCGRPAVRVFAGEVGWCGVSDGGDKAAGRCVFCGGDRHTKPWGDPDVCPNYRLNPGAVTP